MWKFKPQKWSKVYSVQPSYGTINNFTTSNRHWPQNATNSLSLVLWSPTAEISNAWQVDQLRKTSIFVISYVAQKSPPQKKTDVSMASCGLISLLSPQFGVPKIWEKRRSEAILTAVLPLEIHHLVAMVVGAAGYMFLQKLEPTVRRREFPQAGKI